MTTNTIVLDANILIRAVLGDRIRNLIFKYHQRFKFFAPDIAYAEARQHLPAIFKKRGIDPAPGIEFLNQLEKTVKPVETELYASLQQKALLRIAMRDENDWPVVACAMVLKCPIWTEDKDFFGTGIATWTSDRVEIYLSCN